MAEKFKSYEDELNKTIRRIVDYHFDQRYERKFDNLVTKEELELRVSKKLDYSVFKKY
jgi:hypothetical protein